MDVALFLQRLAAQIRQYQPELIDGFLAALQILADAAADRALVQVLAANDVAAAVAYLTTAQAVDAAFQAWRDAYRTAVIGSGRYVTRNVLPKFAPPTTGAPTIVAVSRFDTLAPQVVRGIRAYEAQAVGDMMGGITEGMRQIILDGVARGINPLEIARELRASIGLTASQEAIIANFRQALLAGDRRVLTYRLRDRRFDPTVRAIRRNGGQLTEAQVEKMVAAYRKRMIAHTAETLARTHALNAQRLAQRLAWQQAIDAGRVNADDLIDTWHTTMDGRERPTHAEMNGHTKPFSVPWNVPGVGAQDYPGQSEFNCRCVAFTKRRIRRASEM